jgi:hypothetical protein
VRKCVLLEVKAPQAMQTSLNLQEPQGKSNDYGVSVLHNRDDGRCRDTDV